MITMALSFGIHDYIEGGVITAVILLNIVVGYVFHQLDFEKATADPEADLSKTIALNRRSFLCRLFRRPSAKLSATDG